MDEHAIGSEQTRGGHAPPDTNPVRSIGDAATLRASAQRQRFRAGDVILGRYKITGEVGQGSMGVVFRCFDEVGGIEVAVKALPSEVSHSSDDMEEIRDNFRLVESLHHPRIAAVKTLERDGESGEYFLIMGYIEGMNLRKYRRELPGGVSPLGDAVRIARQIAQALDEAHGRGIIHRDIKPGNVMVAPSGEVKVLDFGLAADVRSSLSRRSAVVVGTSGTPPYMPPEQWEGRRQGPATDQYALAALVYELLVGEVPFKSVFDSGNMEQMQRVVCTQPPEPIPGLDKRTWRVLERGLAKYPDERFGSCGEFVNALGGGKLTTKAPRASGRVGLPLALVLVAILGFFFYRFYQSRQDAPEAARRDTEQAKMDAGRRGRVTEQAKMDAVEEIADPKTIDLGEGVKLELVWCPPGTFMMGSSMAERRAAVAAGGKTEDYKGETQHKVTLTKGFWLGKYEVTNGEYQEFLKSSGYKGKPDAGKDYLKHLLPASSMPKGAEFPICWVSWKNAVAFCKWLTDRETAAGRLPDGYAYRLPTEAEWEYAARGGPKSKGFTYSGSNDAGKVAWYDQNSDKKTHVVGQKEPNELGIYDMSGNVWEWCLDWYGDYPVGAATDPTGAEGSNRVFRGGGWNYFARDCRSADRCRGVPSFSSFYLGFRVALGPVR
jgi:eukaryotic-like serine/threonine-protein kinase